MYFSVLELQFGSFLQILFEHIFIYVFKYTLNYYLRPCLIFPTFGSLQIGLCLFFFLLKIGHVFLFLCEIILDCVLVLAVIMLQRLWTLLFYSEKYCFLFVLADSKWLALNYKLYVLDHSSNLQLFYC